MRRVLTSLVLSAALLGCGGQDADDEAAEIRTVVDRANSSFAADEYAETCSYYTPRVHEELTSSLGVATCEESWKVLAKVLRKSLTPEQFRAFTRYGVERVRVDGDTATATYGEPPEAIADIRGVEAGEVITLRRLDGDWRIDSLPGG